MNLGEWAYAAGAAVAAAALVNAGVAKLVAPDGILQAVRELAPLRARPVGTWLARGFGAAELIAGVGLLIAPVRLLAAIATTLLGTCFVAFGALGLARGSRLPCGCFGAVSTRPLGWTNIGLGAALGLAWPAVGLVMAARAVEYSQAALLLGSIAVVLMCLWLNKSLIAVPRRAPRAATSGGEVR